MADDHHYEALYEVINPRLPSAGAAASVTLLDHNDDSFDDSFDSDDAFEEVVVRGLVFKKKKMASSLKEIVFQFLFGFKFNRMRYRTRRESVLDRDQVLNAQKKVKILHNDRVK